jgi:CubicO group peptidase (beta-lactamase class C family)
VSALVGIALAAGVIQSLDQPIVQWFPEYSDLDTDARGRVTLKHALTMTSGLTWNESLPYNDPANDAIRMTRDSQPLRYVLSRVFAADPGSEFNYNSGLSEAMAAVLERATANSFQDYARAKLFDPLGIDTFEWLGNLAGKPEAASGLRLRARDLAKFGSLYLHDGQWNGAQVIPADWVTLSTRRHFSFPPPSGADTGGEFGYAYYWWYFCFPTTAGLIEARTAFGNGQQWIFVLPGVDMVVTMLGGRYNDLTTAAMLGTRILREHLMPAVKADVQPGCPGS